MLGDILRTFELTEQELDENDPWSEFLSAAGYAIRCTYHTTLEASPAQLVFGRDMLLPIKIKADWTRIHQKRQNAINKNNERENHNDDDVRCLWLQQLKQPINPFTLIFNCNR